MLISYAFPLLGRPVQSPRSGRKALDHGFIPRDQTRVLWGTVQASVLCGLCTESPSEAGHPPTLGTSLYRTHVPSSQLNTSFAAPPNNNPLN